MNRKGFTLIGLLIVVVIIGILAAIAIPKFANAKEKAVVASMKSDLRNLVTAQEGFFSDNQDYARWFTPAQVNGLGGAGKVAFEPVDQQRARDQLHRRRGLVRDGPPTRPSPARRTTSAASSWAILPPTLPARVWLPQTSRAPRSATEARTELRGGCTGAAALVRRPLFRREICVSPREWTGLQPVLGRET